MPPGALEVTVTNAADGKPIDGAPVTITSPSGARTGTTDSNGKVLFPGLPPDNYDVTASKSGFTTETNSGVSVPPGSGAAGATPAKTEVKLTPITVTLAFPLPVACPGHAFEMNATGTPAGGTFAWTVSGGGALLRDGGGSNPRTSGPQVFLVSFQPDNANGKIPAQSASVTVTYTVRGGSPSATQTVPIHGIDFVVTDDKVTSGVLQAVETASDVNIVSGTPTVLTDPKVEIQLGASCPRKTLCAATHRAGWLQTIRTFTASGRYTDTLQPVTCSPLPIRDAITMGSAASVTPPFYSLIKLFTGDRSKVKVHHEDSPGMKFFWVDGRPGAPSGDTLRNLSRTNDFTAWLVIQNTDWDNAHPNDGFVFLRNFDWSIGFSVTVDTSKPVNKRCTPKRNNPTVPAAMGTGKGTQSPSFTTKVFNNSLSSPANAAPHIP